LREPSERGGKHVGKEGGGPLLAGKRRGEIILIKKGKRGGA